MAKMVTTMVDVLVERDIRSGAILGASLASPDGGAGLPLGNLEALAFDRAFNHVQVRKLTGREHLRSLIRTLGFASAAACLTLTTGLLVGICVSV